MFDLNLTLEKTEEKVDTVDKPPITPVAPSQPLMTWVNDSDYIYLIAVTDMDVDIIAGFPMDSDIGKEFWGDMYSYIGYQIGKPFVQEILFKYANME